MKFVHIGDYTLAPNNGGWSVFDWTRDEDLRWFRSQRAAIRYARTLRTAN